MFVDEATFTATAGRGGDGIIAFRREKYVPRGGPAGGNGGKGGDVVLVATTNCNTLSDFRHQRHIKAKSGRPGGPNNKTGANGDDVRLEVPIGTLVYDAETEQLLADLTEEGETVVVAAGGDGGFGNAHFTTSTRRAPKHATPGYPGEVRDVKLELKLIADVALVGYPSVGKSTIIATLSNARPKIADYPFTTLVPNLGVVKFGDFGGYVIADVPGLIEGASEGHGLGIQFLKHIERTNVVAHVIEVTPQLSGHEDERDPIEDFERITAELEKFNADLVERPTLVVLNKCDLPFVAERVDELRSHFEERGLPFHAVSAATGEGMEELRNWLGNAITTGAFDHTEDWER